MEAMFLVHLNCCCNRCVLCLVWRVCSWLTPSQVSHPNFKQNSWGTISVGAAELSNLKGQRLIVFLSTVKLAHCEVSGMQNQSVNICWKKEGWRVFLRKNNNSREDCLILSISHKFRKIFLSFSNIDLKIYLFPPGKKNKNFLFCTSDNVSMQSEKWTHIYTWNNMKINKDPGWCLLRSPLLRTPPLRRGLRVFSWMLKEALFPLLCVFLSEGPCEQGHRFENISLSLEFRSCSISMAHKLGGGRGWHIFLIKPRPCPKVYQPKNQL